MKAAEGDAREIFFELDRNGRAVQLEPMKPKLKPPGTKRLKPNFDVLLSTSAFKFNLRRYTTGMARSVSASSSSQGGPSQQALNGICRSQEALHRI
jgi:hypothetical protein